MRFLKKLSAWALAAAMLLSMSVSACAAEQDTGYADVSADAWYADAAVYCRENGVMNGISDSAFGPDAAMSRAMLATVLYRAAGSPEVSGRRTFSDVPAGAYYADAVAWASENGIVSGYGSGLFGSDDPVTREQIAAILWRYDGSKSLAGTLSFTDASAVSSYAAEAVRWAAANGIVTGMADGSFAPQAGASRAQVAAMLYRYLNHETPAPSEDDTAENAAVLVAYFSATGTTEGVAEKIADALHADLYEITPEEPYTSADLNYNDSSSRVSTEHNDPSIRPAIAGSVENMGDYDVIFLGYPIWWGQAPQIIRTFLESYDLSGKTVVPFCTSASSDIGSSASNLHSLAENAVWLEGRRFSGGVSDSSIVSWINGLNLDLTAE